MRLAWSVPTHIGLVVHSNSNMCECAFCWSKPQDISIAFSCPAVLVGRSQIDNSQKVFVLTDDPRRGQVMTSKGSVSSLSEVCAQWKISYSDVFLRDQVLGVVRLESLKSIQYKVDSLRKRALRGVLQDPTRQLMDCTASHSVANTDLMAIAMPSYAKRLRALPAAASNKRAKPSGGDLHSLPASMWTTDAVTSYLRRDNSSLDPEKNPPLVAVLDERRYIIREEILCKFMHSDGTYVSLWMPQSIVYLSDAYHNTWKEFKETKREDDDIAGDNWDRFDPDED